MKKLSLILVSLILFPAMLSAQYQVKAVHQEPVDLEIEIPGYNASVAKATMNLNFEFDQATETLTVHMGKGKTNCPYNKVWLIQHDVPFTGLEAYAKERGIKLKKDKTYTDQEKVIGFKSDTEYASIKCQGMTFKGIYDLKVPKKMKVKKQLDYQMVPLDGLMVLDLAFNVTNKAKNVTLTLRNPIPLNRKGGKKAYMAFVAQDITINIELGRCKDAEQNILTIQEYENMFAIAEEKLIELKKSPSNQKAYKDFIMRLYGEIDVDRFANTGCDEIEASYDNWMETMRRIEEMGKSTGGGGGVKPEPSGCDVAKLNGEIKSISNKLNNLVNDINMASDAASKAEKKASFDATVKSFDEKLNNLPSGCKAKLDAKLLKNYEFVKKLGK